METQTTFTLDPTTDPAALTALHVYLYLTRNNEMRSRLQQLPPPEYIDEASYDALRWEVWRGLTEDGPDHINLHRPNERGVMKYYSTLKPRLVVTERTHKEKSNV